MTTKQRFFVAFSLGMLPIGLAWLMYEDAVYMKWDYFAYNLWVLAGLTLPICLIYGLLLWRYRQREGHLNYDYLLPIVLCAVAWGILGYYRLPKVRYSYIRINSYLKYVDKGTRYAEHPWAHFAEQPELWPYFVQDSLLQNSLLNHVDIIQNNENSGSLEDHLSVYARHGLLSKSSLALYFALRERGYSQEDLLKDETKHAMLFNLALLETQESSRDFVRLTAPKLYAKYARPQGYYQLGLLGEKEMLVIEQSLLRNRSRSEIVQRAFFFLHSQFALPLNNLPKVLEHWKAQHPQDADYIDSLWQQRANFRLLAQPYLGSDSSLAVVLPDHPLEAGYWRILLQVWGFKPKAPDDPNKCLYLSIEEHRMGRDPEEHPRDYAKHFYVQQGLKGPRQRFLNLPSYRGDIYDERNQRTWFFGMSYRYFNHMWAFGYQ